MTWEASHAKPFPVGGNPWRRVTNRRTTDALTLSEILILRRMSGGMTQAEAARDLHWSPTTVSSALRNLRILLGVSSTADLLVLPRVLEQLEADGAA